jgi:hypothetical protein
MTDDFGVEATNDDDLSYRGSIYSEVRDAIFANPYQRVWGQAGGADLPVYPVTLSGVLRGILSFGARYLFLQASKRVVDSAADLRWGRNGRGFRRILHPNGVCLTGEWKITEDSEYTGYFAKGSTALTIGRYSTCCTETRRGYDRSLALVGKLFPTNDPNDPTRFHTANFITQQDIGGALIDSINDAELLNAPDTTASRRGSGLPILLVTGVVLGIADKQPTIRQLYQIAELGKPQGQPTRSPEFMRLLISAEQPRIEGKLLDFRDEIMAQIFDKGHPKPQRKLIFNIEVTDEGQTSGTALRQRRKFQGWRRIGTLTFNDAVISWNGDSVIHFNHPTWRSNRNDPTTATRVNGRKVR